MPSYPIKICVACGEEFQLRPGKPGFANRCPACSEEKTDGAVAARTKDGQKGDKDLNDSRRRAMRDLLYRKDI